MSVSENQLGGNYYNTLQFTFWLDEPAADLQKECAFSLGKPQVQSTNK